MSINSKKNEEAVHEIYKRMFKEAEPSADIDKIRKSGEGKQRDFFMKYYLDQERQEEIIDEVCKEFKIDSYSKRGIRTFVTLGSSPTGSKEAWGKFTKGQLNAKDEVNGK